MIYKLRNKFIKISGLSLVAVLLVVFGSIFFFNISQLNSTMDTLTDTISENDGRIPDFRDGDRKPDFKGNDISKPVNSSEDNQSNPSNNQDDRRRNEPRGILNPETQFSTRFFTVHFGNDGEVAKTNTSQIAAITEEEAISMAKTVAQKAGSDRGWISSYRYKINRSDSGTTVIFVDGAMNKTMSANFIISSGLVLLGMGIVVFLLIIFFSKKAVRPVAESYEKQKQFITDANHELKTPLTLILANLDIAENELGKNEWLDDIRYEGEQMKTLVGRLVDLSRMDEESNMLTFSIINVSETLLDMTSEFEVGAKAVGKNFEAIIEPNVTAMADETAVRQIVSVLLDNALKYCDPNGTISCSLSGGKHVTITVTNTFKDVSNTELDRLFDRFYRSDKARTAGGGYGIGLSLAKSIAEKHKGELNVYKVGDDRIEFKLKF